MVHRLWIMTSPMILMPMMSLRLNQTIQYSLRLTQTIAVTLILNKSFKSYIREYRFELRFEWCVNYEKRTM